MKIIYKRTTISLKTALPLLLISLYIISCGNDPIPVPPVPEPKPEPPVVIKEGISWSLTAPDADKELTIWFKASSSSPLYNYTGDVYIHTGVVSEGTWLHVPAAWEQNITKCKMTKVDNEKSAWSIKLSPSIRQWFNSGETPVNKIGIVIRNADGTKKGIENDTFITGITDSKYKPFQPAAIKQGTLPSELKHGINIVNNTSVTLVLYDKDKNGVGKDFAHVVGDFNNWTLSNDDKSQMFRDNAAGCWWITITGLDPAKEYGFQYYVGNNGKDPIRVADPYSRKILDPDNDKYISATTYPNLKAYPAGAIGIVSLFKTTEEPYNWQTTGFKVPSRDNLVIYELLLRDFTTSGDLSGTMGKLDYLQSLGINAIELMPVQEFDGNDSWGYNPAFYFAMDKAYGTDRMYKEFIDECHKRGIAVILDVVYNHATGANPFAKMWWDSANNHTAANNPLFNVTAPHPFSVFHDFDHSNPLVRNFVKRNLEFLLDEYKVDGFRFDLSKGFTQKQSSDDGVFRVYDANRISYLKEYNSAIKAKKADALVILEHFTDDKEETELSDAGMMVWRNNNEAYLEAAMGWKSKADFSRVYYGYVTSPRPANSLVSYMESHDEERAAYKQVTWGNGIIKTDLGARMSQLGANAAFFFTVPGPKMIWQFGELGYDYSIMSDPNGIVHDYNNDQFKTSKKPVKWDYYNITQRKQLYDTYARLMKLRSDHPELFNATATLSWQVTPSYWDNGRFSTLSSFGNTKQVVVVGNFTNDVLTTTTPFPKTGTWYNYMKPGETLDVTSTSMPIAVPANSFRMYSTFQN